MSRFVCRTCQLVSLAVCFFFYIYLACIFYISAQNKCKRFNKALPIIFPCLLSHFCSLRRKGKKKCLDVMSILITRPEHEEIIHGPR